MTDNEKIAVAGYQKGFQDGFAVGSIATGIFIIGAIYACDALITRCKKKNA